MRTKNLAIENTEFVHPWIDAIVDYEGDRKSLQPIQYNTIENIKLVKVPQKFNQIFPFNENKSLYQTIESARREISREEWGESSSERESRSSDLEQIWFNSTKTSVNNWNHQISSNSRNSVIANRIRVNAMKRAWIWFNTRWKLESKLTEGERE